MEDMRRQAVIGVVAPELSEARLAMRWPSVSAFPGIARLGSSIQQAANALLRNTLRQPAILAGLLLIVALPIALLMAFGAWLMLAPLYFSKLLPFFGTRYGLTNRRLMIQKGIQAVPSKEVKLEEISEVRVVPGSEQPFYRSADLEVISFGKPVMLLRGVPEYQSFLVNIENARLAWGRKEQPKEQTHPASELSKK